MNSSKNRNKLYNFLVNSYGISQELVLQTINERVDSLISKCIGMTLNSNKVERVIANQVADVIGKGFKQNPWENITIETYIKHEIARQIEEKMNTDYELEVNLKRKSKGTVTYVGRGADTDLKEKK